MEEEIIELNYKRPSTSTPQYYYYDPQCGQIRYGKIGILGWSKTIRAYQELREERRRSLSGSTSEE